METDQRKRPWVQFLPDLHFKTVFQNHLPFFSSAVTLVCILKWAVCHCEAMPGETYRAGVCCQIHEEAPERGEPAGGTAGGDREGGEHAAADPAPQHRHAARRL